MKYLVAVDPGKHASGVAVFTDGHLAAAYYATDLGVLAWLSPHEVSCIVEIPQVYAHGKSKGDPNDLVDLAFAAGRITGHFPEVETIRPGQWKGQLPKSVHHARVRATLSATEWVAVERAAPASKLHNVLDAVGLGLWKLGRLRASPLRAV